MQFLKKIFRPTTVCQGIVGISFLHGGFSAAISKYNTDKSLSLVHAEIIPLENHHDLAAKLAKFVNLHHLGEYDCHLVLTADYYRRINIETPQVPEAELPQAIRWKIIDLLDFPVEQAVIDFFPAPAFGHDTSNTLEVIASPMQTIKEQSERCLAAGLQLKVIDIQETTLRNLAMMLPEHQQGAALLHMQEFSATMLIQKAGTIYVHRNFEIGYQFSEDGLDEFELENLATEIQRSLDFADSYYGISSLMDLAVIAATEKTLGMVAKLNSHYGIKAYVLDIPTVIDCDILLDYPTQSLCAPVIGATLRYVVETL